jgi:hypothetical protein
MTTAVFGEASRDATDTAFWHGCDPTDGSGADPYLLLDVLHRRHHDADRRFGAECGREISADLPVAQQMRGYVDAAELWMLADLAVPGCAGDPSALVEEELGRQGFEPHTPPEVVEAAREDLTAIHAQRLAAAEAAVRMKLSPGQARAKVAHAVDLCRNLPNLVDALRCGLIDLERAVLIANRTKVLDKEEQRRRVADQALDAADEPGVTTRRLQSIVDTFVVAADPAAAQERRRRALADRSVSVRPGDDGMATFTAYIPAEDAAMVMAVLHRFAGTDNPLDIGSSGDDGDARTFGQRRADGFVDIFGLLGIGGTVGLQPADHDHDHSADTAPTPADVAEATRPRDYDSGVDADDTTATTADPDTSCSTAPAPESAATSESAEAPTGDAAGGPTVAPVQDAADSVSAVAASSAASAADSTAADPRSPAAADCGDPAPRHPAADPCNPAAADPCVPAPRPTVADPCNPAADPTAADPCNPAAADCGDPAPRPTAAGPCNSAAHRAPDSVSAAAGLADATAAESADATAAKLADGAVHAPAAGTAARSTPAHGDALSCAHAASTGAPHCCCAPSAFATSGLPGFAIGTRQGRSAHLVVTVSAETLAALDNDPGQLGGHGVMTAEWCRQIARAAASFTVVAVDDRGRPTDCSSTLYRPRQSIRDRVVTLNPTCVFPGCALPAQRCDLDHLQPFDHHHPERGGPTEADNLAPVCRQHHRLKTFGGWSYHRDRNTYVWVSPLGTTIRRAVDALIPEPPAHAGAPSQDTAGSAAHTTADTRSGPNGDADASPPF